MLTAYAWKLNRIPERMIHHIVGTLSTVANAAMNVLVCAVRPAPSDAPRAGSRIRHASTARMSPGTHATKNAARQPQAAAMLPLRM
jgi:hypothetical protein